jgi:hypothetical protein
LSQIQLLIGNEVSLKMGTAFNANRTARAFSDNTGEFHVLEGVLVGLLSLVGIADAFFSCTSFDFQKDYGQLPMLVTQGLSDLLALVAALIALVRQARRVPEGLTALRLAPAPQQIKACHGLVQGLIAQAMAMPIMG